MKRLIPVLVITLILTFMSWEDASSRRYPELRKETVQLDHPWGGEQHYTENPPILLSAPAPDDDLNVIEILKSWFGNANKIFLYRFGESTRPSTEIVTPETQPNPETSQQSGGGGAGL